MHIGENEKLVPIECRDGVLAVADMIGEGVHDGLIQRRHLVRPQVLRPEQAINRARCDAREELAFRIGPPIVFRSGDMDGVRSIQGDQFMHIDRKPIDLMGVHTKNSTTVPI